MVEVEVAAAFVGRIAGLAGIVEAEAVAGSLLDYLAAVADNDVVLAPVLVGMAVAADTAEVEVVQVLDFATAQSTRSQATPAILGFCQGAIVTAETAAAVSAVETVVEKEVVRCLYRCDIPAIAAEPEEVALEALHSHSGIAAQAVRTAGSAVFLPAEAAKVGHLCSCLLMVPSAAYCPYTLHQV